MFAQGGEKPNIKPGTQGGTNLTLLVFVLGILSLTSIGIMTLSVVKQLQPTAFTAINKQLNYQGKLQNSGGITLADGNYSMKFSVYDAASAGTRLWTECGTVGTPTVRTVAVANGVFSVLLGDTVSGACPGATNSNAITLDFNSDSYYLGFTMESDSEMLPRKRLGASGYAFNADLLDGLNTSAAGGTGAYVPITDGSGNLVLSKNFTVDSTTLFVDSSTHRVGILDASPLAALTVGDGDLFQVNSSGAIAAATGITSSGTINFSGLTASLAVYTDASKNLTSTAPASGTIGYWSRATTTLSPATANDIVAVTGNTGDLLTLTSTATGASNKALSIAASGATVGTDYGAYISNIGAATTNVGLYATASGATNNYAAIFEAGRVGIGTTAPGYGLDVETGSIKVNNNITGAGSSGTIYLGDSSFTKAYGSAWVFTGGFTAGAGYGVTLGSITIDPSLSGANGIYLPSWAITGSPTYGYGISINAPTGATNNYAAIFNGGNVGIGDTTPAAMLTVGNTDLFQVNSAGAIAAATGITSSGTINFSGLTASSAVYTDASKNLTSTAPASGAIGYWSRATTTLSPATANDIVAVTGNSGDLLTLTSTATGASNKALSIAASGATVGTDYGAYISNTGAATTNVGLYATASGATNNYAAVFEAGNVGIGTTTPGAKLGFAAATTAAGGIDFGGDVNLYRSAANVLKSDDDFSIGSIYFEAGSGRIYSNYMVNISTSSNASLNLATTGTIITRNIADANPALTVSQLHASSTGDILQLKNNGGSVFIVSQAGNVGIGDTTPAAMFTVGNTDLFQVNSSGAIAAATGITSSGTINFSGLTASLAVYTDGSKNLTSTPPASGAIGYWSRATTTLSPTTANDIVAITGNSGDLLTLTSTATGASNKALSIAASGATVGTDYGAYISNTGVATTNVGLYATASGATNNYAAIFDGGNVGIGTTSPNVKLTIQSTDTRGVSNNTKYLSQKTSDGLSYFDISDTSGYWTVDAANANGGVVIFKSGFGVYNGAYILNANVGGAIYFNSDSSISIKNSGAVDYARFYSSTNGLSLGTGYTATAAPTNGMIIQGNVGIGTTSPTGKLDIVGSQNFSAFSAPGALTAGTPTTGGSCDPGTHSYKVTFVSVGSGETTGGTTSNQITCVLTTGQTVPLSGIPLGPTGTIARKIYRTVAGDLGSYLLLTTISDNTTTIYSDTTADAALGAAAPVSNTTAVANIQTGGTTRMVIDNSGRVGIGTTTPAYTLDVSSSLGRTINAANSAAGGVGVYGVATDATAFANYGGYFTAAGTGGTASGVYGEASGGANTVFGVYGVASATGAYTNYGGSFVAAGNTGRGAYGEASYTGAAINYGGFFAAQGETGRGVYGVGLATTATANYGGYFLAQGTGSLTSGAYGEASGAGTVYGVRGYASATGAVTNFGGAFETAGQTGRGVYGAASNTGATVNYGGYFIANGTGAGTSGIFGTADGAASVYGVQGTATNTGAVTNYGGYFTAAGQTARGVYGSATDFGAVQNFGGFFEAAGTSFASGVYGRATGAGTVYGVQGIASDATAVTNYGGYFIAWGDTGYGVYGEAGDTGTSPNYGGFFKARGKSSYGVYGLADNAAGTNYGVYGSVTAGYGVYGYYSATQFGYLGDASYGVYGRGTTGVYGTDGTRYGYLGGGSYGAFGLNGSYWGALGGASYGVYGTSATTYGYLGGGYGAFGFYDGTHYGYIGGASYGVYGTGDTGEGVHGEATTGYGVRGNATTGYGAAGFLSGTTGRAVWGSAYNASGTTTYGGYFNSSGTSGYGVYALADAVGTVYGVYGEASNVGAAVTNYGVYGTSAGGTGRGVYGAATYSATATINYGGYFSSAGTGTGATGVYGVASGTGTVYGVQGYASNTGAYENYGGYFIANGTTARAVYGQAGTSGATVSFGGYFSTSSTGAGTAGIYGIAAGGGTVYGVLGQATNTGAWTNYGGVFSAAGDTGRAVYGEASDAGAVANYGGYFTAAGTGGARGVYASAGGASGTNYGVYGAVTSATGYAGYFTGGYGLYGSRGQYARAPSGNDTSYGLVVQGATCIDDGTANCPATPTSGTIYTEGAALISFDLAELYESTELLEAGDVVSIDLANDKKMVKSTGAYQDTTMGVISTKPGITLGGWSAGPGKYPVALAGRVPVKVNDENGAIAIGDLLTSSSTSGVAMRATRPGSTIGRALEAWSMPGQGAVEVFMAPGWNAAGTIATDGTAIFLNDDFTFNKLGTADGIIQGYDSKGLTFRGSGWDGAAAQNVEMRLNNIVTDALNYKLSVLNNAGQEVAYLDQAGAFGLSGKFYPASPTGAQNTAYIFYRNNRMRTNAAGWATGSFDFAEMFLSRELLEAGDVVILDETANEYVKKSTTAYNNMALGIVSTEPGFLAGANVDFDDPSADQGYPVALAGRVPTKVSVENGPIRPGDFLTTSSTPGVAMKAIEPGMIIGTALQSFDGPEIGLIKVFVNLSWYNVSGEVTPVSEMAQLTLSGDLNMNGNYILNVGKIVGHDEKWSIDENGVLKIRLVSEDATEKEMFGLSSAKVELTLSGTGRLENGSSMIDLSLVDPDFIKNISAETALKIIVTLTEPANGVYVAEKTAYSFRVAELNAGTSDAAFDWIVIARRKGYDDPPTGGTPAPSAPAPSVPAPAPSEPSPTEPPPAPSEPAPSEPAPSEPAPTPSEPAPSAPSEPAPTL